MLVIVADNGADDRPDPKTLKGFIMPSSIGLNYLPGVWREWRESKSWGVLMSDHPSLILDETLDLACIETQVSTGIPEPDERDCELLSWEGGEPFGRIHVPVL